MFCVFFMFADRPHYHTLIKIIEIGLGKHLGINIS